MSTNAIFTFRAKNQPTHRIYMHWDGSPEGARMALKNTLNNAWALPRFETGEFAAAFVFSNKGDSGGNVYLLGNREGHDYMYLYDVDFYDGELHVAVTHHNVTIFNGTLKEFFAKYA